MTVAEKTRIKKFPYAFAKVQGILLAYKNEKPFLIAKKNINNTAILEAFRVLGEKVPINTINDAEFSEQLASIYQQKNTTQTLASFDVPNTQSLDSLAHQITSSKDLLANHNDTPVISLLNGLISEALAQKASDIHFESYSDKCVVRFRIDGELHKTLQLPNTSAPLVISRIKIMARLDIAIKRAPQDGRFTVNIGKWPIDCRVSSVPTLHGERVVLRLLDKRYAKLAFNKLGINPDMEKNINTLIHKNHGLILVTGPTGSGKTTTLYSMLAALNKPGKNILTVEDPIEYHLPGIGQIEVNAKTQMTFAAGLRAILRQDPDIIMLGEIRDTQTAKMAVQASLTGHLVLSTLHTNTALGAITRLQDMGVESFLLAPSLIGIMSQRLIRLLCEHCKIAYRASDKELKLLNTQKNNITLYKQNGCDKCNHTGYKNRTGIYELIMINDEIKTRIHSNASEQQLRAALKNNTTLQQDGYDAVLTGKTSLSEIINTL